MTIEIPCNLTEQDAPLIVNKEGVLGVNRFKLSSSGKIETLCCLNKSVFLKSYGQGCVESSRNVRIQSERCNFSQDITGICQQDLNTRKVSNYCKIPGTSCVIQKYVVQLCSSDKEIACDFANMKC